MGKLTNLNPPTQITDSDIPAAIARDTEVTAAFNAHLTAIDPHSQYLLQSEGDARYRQTSVSFFVTAPLPTANVGGNSIAFSWNSVQPGLGVAEFCNFAGLGGGDAFNFFRMPGNAAASPSLSHRISRIDIAGAYIQVSDARLKSHFSEAPGLKVIMALNPVRYRHWPFVGSPITSLKLEKNCLHKIGFVAQEVKQHIPEAVPTTSSDSELYGLDYNCIVACLVAAVKEQQNLLNDLRTQLQAFKG